MSGGSGRDSFTTGILWLDDCTHRTGEICVATAAGTLGALAVLTCFLHIKLKKKGSVSKRYLFHASRVVPWSLLIIIVIFGIYVNAHAAIVKRLRVEQFVGKCISAPVTAGLVYFSLLLVYDLVWLGGVFWNLHKKPFLLVHHMIYIAWVILTLLGYFEYVRLVFLVAALEESQEAIASISYLRKDKSDGPWWLFFCIAWRLMCSAFALGVMCLFLLIGTMDVEMKVFMIVEMLLWIVFLWQEWRFLFELVVPKGEDGGASESDDETQLESTSEDGNDVVPRAGTRLQTSYLRRSTTTAF